ncbi:hypothetical protein ABK040_001845 [Willaertia magna]
MSSGFGLRSKNGRCYGNWMDYRGCMYHSKEPQQCSLQLEDYIECMHHFKESEWHKQVEKKILAKRDEFKHPTSVKKETTSSHH